MYGRVRIRRFESKLMEDQEWTWIQKGKNLYDGIE